MASKQLLENVPVGSGVRASLPGGSIVRPTYTSNLSGGYTSSFVGSSSAAGSFPAGTTDTQQSAALHSMSGFVADYVGPAGTGAGSHYSRTYGGVATWTAGQVYQQWAIVFDPAGAGSQCYTKFSAGASNPLARPSATPADWRLIETPGTSAPALFGGELIQTGLSLAGNQPARLQLLADNIGDSATLVGRSADGVTAPDALFRVNGFVDCEALRLRNVIHAGNPTFGSATIATGSSSFAVSTTACDVTSLVFVQLRSAPGGAGGMILAVTNKGAGGFTCSCIVPTTGAVGNAAGNLDFDWWILNPVY